jgi:hypothetical protein
MGFLVRIEPVLRVSEYNGKTKDNNDYCIASWKVKNVVDGTLMLVSCFGNDDEILRNHPGVSMDATLTIVCRDWTKDGRSGTMNNVTLSSVIGPDKPTDLPGGDIAPPPINNSLDPSAVNDLPF